MIKRRALTLITTKHLQWQNMKRGDVVMQFLQQYSRGRRDTQPFTQSPKSPIAIKKCLFIASVLSYATQQCFMCLLSSKLTVFFTPRHGLENPKFVCWFFIWKKYRGRGHRPCMCVCVFFTLNRSSTRRHPAHPVSVLILHPRKISSVVTSNDTEIMHRNAFDNAMSCPSTGYDMEKSKPNRFNSMKIHVVECKRTEFENATNLVRTWAKIKSKTDDRCTEVCDARKLHLFIRVVLKRNILKFILLLPGQNNTKMTLVLLLFRGLKYEKKNIQGIPRPGVCVCVLHIKPSFYSSTSSTPGRGERFEEQTKSENKKSKK